MKLWIARRRGTGQGKKKDSLFHWDLDKQKENSRYVENKVLSMSTSQCGVQTPEGWKTRYSEESSDSNKLSSPWKIHAVTGKKKVKVTKQSLTSSSSWRSSAEGSALSCLISIISSKVSRNVCS